MLNQEKDSLWYQARFEAAMSRAAVGLKPIHPKIDFAGIKPDFYTSIILRRFEDNRFELLIDKDPNKEYKWGDHTDILDQYKIADDYTKTSNGFLFTSQSQRYLMLNVLGGVFANDKQRRSLKGIAELMLRYKVMQLFSIRITTEGYRMEQTFIPIDAKMVDEMLFNGWTSDMARYHNWTNFEWLRFRLAMQIPECRKSSSSNH
ncbi:hypothetical protein M1437_02830 [Patescibacteria group bacterium]|nr:hypothetical protein [Patescibacteria group bacterium]